MCTDTRMASDCNLSAHVLRWLCKSQTRVDGQPKSNESFAFPHLLTIDLLQVEVMETVDDKGAPQSQTDHWIALWMDGQLLQPSHLS